MGDAVTVKKPRIVSIDILRGIVMIVMVLDHVREFFSSAKFSPSDLTQASAGLFLTRWVTHFCAPVFVFLAGTSAFLYLNRGKTKAELSKFLFTRGLFLIFAELIIVRFCCSFNFNYHDTAANICQVIWVIGWSMMFLSCIVHFPSGVIAFIGIVMVAGHNLLDGIDPSKLGNFGWLFIVLHVREVIMITPGFGLGIVYPLIPWVGVMALGFLFGNILALDEAKRRRVFFVLGLSLTAAFVIIRAINIYGDPSRWAYQKDLLFTIFSFINCSKYPPSLLFLLMTLGPAIFALSFMADKEGPLARIFLVFGRVPFFLYIVHLFVIHGIALILSFIKYGVFPAWMFQGNPIFSTPAFPSGPADYGYDLPVVYVIWAAVTAGLFPLCRWYMNFKKTHNNPIFSYI
jgi:uncharacterized membrane protein